MNESFLFLNIGFAELTFVLAFVLIFFGAESLPKMARTLGRGMRQIRNASGEIQRELQGTAQKMMDEVDTEKKKLDNPEE